jgi:hypothetical protein
LGAEAAIVVFVSLVIVFIVGTVDGATISGWYIVRHNC